MIITVEGCDGSGKTTLAKRLSEEFNYSFFDTDYLRAEDKGPNWKSVVFGLNIALCQLYNSLDNFCKARFQLSEYVYQKFFNRDGIDFNKIDVSGIDKNFLILVDITYEQHVNFIKSRGLIEDPLDENTFNTQRKLFIEAFVKSNVHNKVILQNNGSMDDLVIKAKEKIKELKEKNKIFDEIIKCNKCPVYINSCCEVNPIYARPILPRRPKDVPEYMFIGISPGRGDNIPFSNKAFSHSSGNILNTVLTKLNVIDKCYFTNVIKCNTLKNKKIDEIGVNNCLSYLKQEIIDINPKHIFLLGNDVNRIITNNLDILNGKDFTKIYHPSYFNYNKDQGILKEWILKINEVL